MTPCGCFEKRRGRTWGHSRSSDNVGDRSKERRVVDVEVGGVPVSMRAVVGSAYIVRVVRLKHGGWEA